MSKIEDLTAALAALESTNEKLADHMKWPVWRHIAGGVVMTVIVAAAGLPTTLALIALALAVVLMIAIVRDDKKRHGMFVSGYQRGRTIWVVAAMIALALIAFIIVRTQLEGGVANPVFWGALAIVFLGVSALSLVWEIVYRKDIREGRV